MWPRCPFHQKLSIQGLWWRTYLQTRELYRAKKKKKGKYNSRWFISAWQHRFWPAPNTQHYKLLSWKLELLLFEVRSRGSRDSVADPHVRGRDIWQQVRAMVQAGQCQKKVKNDLRAESIFNKGGRNGIWNENRNGLVMKEHLEKFHLHWPFEERLVRDQLQS